MTSVAINVDQLYSPVPGGTGTYVRELLPALRAADPALEVTAFHGRADPASAPGLDGVRSVEIPAGIRSLYPRWALSGRPPLPAELASLDVLHATFPAAVPPPGPRQRLVVTVHDLAFRIHPQLFPAAWRTLYRLGLRRAVRRADALLAVSEHTAGDLVRLCGVERGRIVVSPLAVSLPARGAEPRAALERLKIRPPYVLFVGTLEPRKNLVRLVRAYRRASVSGLPHALVLAGPIGWQSQALHRELTVPAGGHVILTGRVTDADLDGLYRAADAFVYPSIYEGFGLPVLEAMARGVPAIVSNTSSLPEVAGDAAVAVDPLSVRALAAAIERVLGDEDLATRLGEAGRTRAGTFSWARTAERTLEAYRG